MTILSQRNDILQVCQGTDFLSKANDKLSQGNDLLCEGSDLLSLCKDLFSGGKDLLSSGNDIFEWTTYCWGVIFLPGRLSLIGRCQYTWIFLFFFLSYCILYLFSVSTARNVFCIKCVVKNFLESIKDTKLIFHMQILNGFLQYGINSCFLTTFFFFLSLSFCHAVSMPLNPLYIGEFGVGIGIHYFPYFCSEHRLWVLVRTTSLRHF